MMCRVSLSLNNDDDVVLCEIKAAGNNKKEERKRKKKRDLERMVCLGFSISKKKPFLKPQMKKENESLNTLLSLSLCLSFSSHF